LILKNQDLDPSEYLPIRSLLQFTILKRFSTDTFTIIEEILSESRIELDLINRYSTLPGANGRDIYNVFRAFTEAKLKLLPNLTKMSLTLDEEY
jgi:hypothetical protein